MEEFWNTILDPVFGIMFGLVLLAFVPLLYSIWYTWRNGGEITIEIDDQTRE